MKIIHEAPLTVNTDSDPVKDGTYVIYIRPTSGIRRIQLRIWRVKSGWGTFPPSWKVCGWIGPLPNLNMECRNE